MGTSKANSGGSGGAWTGFKRNASLFARHGGHDRAAKALAGYVAAAGGVGGALAAAAEGVRAGQSLGAFLVASSGPAGLADGLRAVGLERLVGSDRFTVLSELVNEFAGAGSDLEAQAARNALLDVLDEILPEDDAERLEDVRLDAARVTDALCRYLSALIYNLAIPVIDERLSQLEDPVLARQRDKELREYIDALVRLRIQDNDSLELDWRGSAGREFVQSILQAVFDQLEHIS